MMVVADTVPLLSLVPITPTKSPTLRADALVAVVLPLAENVVNFVLAE